jgi:tetratricopeptide (TPR) repeat protein
MDRVSDAGWDYMKIADLYQRDGCTESERSNLLDKMVELRDGWPQNAVVRFVLGKYEHRLEWDERAVSNLEEAVTLGGLPDRHTLEAHVIIGESYAKLNEYESALLNIRKASKMAPGDHDLAYRLVQMRLEHIAFDISEIERAMEKEESGPDPEDRLRLAILCQAQGDYDRAIRELQPLASIDGVESRSLLELGKCYLSLNRANLARVSLRSSLEKGDMDPQQRKNALYNLAEACRRLLMFDEAIDALEQVCSVDASYRGAHRLLSRLQYERSRQGQIRTISVPISPALIVKNIIENHGSPPSGMPEEDVQEI